MSEDNIAKLRDFYQTAQQGQKKAAKLLDSQIEWIEPESPGSSVGGVHHGPQAVFDDELRGKDLEKREQAPASPVPPRCESFGERELAKPGRKPRWQGHHHAEDHQVKAQPAEHDRPEAVDCGNPMPLPRDQAEPGKRQHDKRRPPEPPRQAPHDTPAIRTAGPCRGS